MSAEYVELRFMLNGFVTGGFICESADDERILIEECAGEVEYQDIDGAAYAIPHHHPFKVGLECGCHQLADREPVWMRTREPTDAELEKLLVSS